MTPQGGELPRRVAAAPPSFLRIVSKVEGAVSPTVRAIVQHEGVGLSMAVVTRLRRGVGRRTERASRHVLHALNLPAGSDVKRLLAQMALIEREVRELGKKLADQAVATEGGRP